MKISIYKDGREVYSTSSSTPLSKIVNKELNDGSTYYEQITEETLPGQFVYAEDGTKIRTSLGQTVLHIIYIKQ